jgi:hypothetical protein
MIATPRGRNVENIIPNSQQERGAAAATAATSWSSKCKCAPSFSHFSSRQQAKTAARDSSQQPPTKSLSRSMQEFKKAEELTSQHVHVTPIEPF